MTLISTKGMYGLQAMYELSLIKSDKPTQIKEIAQNANIPQNYLEQLLVLLRRAKLVESIRGAHGGYKLAKEPKDISVKEVFVALEGDLYIVDAQVENPVIDLFYEESKNKIEKIFELSLDDLHGYSQRLGDQLHYSI